MKYSYPESSSGQASIVSIDAELVPIVTGALKRFLLPFVWETPADYRRGYNAIAALLAQMPNNYIERLVRASEFTARLLNTSLNGQQYTVENGEVVPPIGLVPDFGTTEPNAMRAHLGRLWHLAENAHTGVTFGVGAGVTGAPALTEDLSWASRILAVQGTTDTGWFTPDEPVTLKRLLEAARLNSEGDRTIVRNAGQAAKDAVDTGANVTDALGDYLQAAADLGTDGGVIAVSAFNTAALLGVLTRINYALNGNPALLSTAPPPLSFALAGDELVTSTNNLLTVLKGLNDASAELQTLVSGINTAIATANTRLLAIQGATEEAADATRDTSSAIGLLGPGPGPNLPALAYLALIADSTERSADCCEGQGGGGNETPAPEPSLSGCSSDLIPTGTDVKFALDFSAVGQLAGPDMVSTANQVQIDMDPAGPGSVIKVAAGIARLAFVLERASEDTAIYGVDVNPFVGEDTVANLPQPTIANQFPASNCVVGLFRAVDFSNDPVFYRVLVTRVVDGNTTPYEGLQPKLTAFVVEAEV